MKNAARILIIAFAIGIIFTIPIYVRADETVTDWNTVDWTNYDWKNVDDPDTMSSLCEWLETEASYQVLFLVNEHCEHAAFMESLSSIIAARFVNDPIETIRELALENKSVQDHVIASIVYDMKRQDLVEVLESVVMTDSESEECYEVLQNLITHAENTHGVDIVNPKTGDPAMAMLVIAVCAFVGVGTLCISRKKLI